MQYIIIALAAFSAPELQIAQEEEAYRITVEPFSPDQEQSVLASIKALMTQTCGEQSAEGLQFGFEEMVPDENEKVAPKVEGYFQTFKCVDPASRPQLLDYDLPDDWRPDEQEEARAKAVGDKFFQEIDAGNFAAAYALSFPSSLGPAERFEQETAEKLAELGPYDRSILLTTWYLHPPGAPRGAYVAFDFWGVSETRALDCGNIVLRRVNDGSYRIQRYEQTVIAKSENMPTETIKQVRQQYCRAWT